MKKQIMVSSMVGLLFSIPAMADADPVAALVAYKTLGLQLGFIASLGGIGFGTLFRAIPNVKVASFGEQLTSGSFIGLGVVAFAGVVSTLVQRLAGVSFS